MAQKQKIKDKLNTKTD